MVREHSIQKDACYCYSCRLLGSDLFSNVNRHSLQELDFVMSIIMVHVAAVHTDNQIIQFFHGINIHKLLYIIKSVGSIGELSALPIPPSCMSRRGATLSGLS